MSSGKAHAAYTKASLCMTAIAAVPLALSGWGVQSVSYIAGLGMGHLMTPDLDLVGTTHEESRVRRKLGHTPFVLYSLLWRPYAKSMRHRGASHKPFVGTASRWLYIAAWGPWALWMDRSIMSFAYFVLWLTIWFPLMISALVTAASVIGAITMLSALLMVFLGNFQQDMVHLAADGFGLK